MSQSPEGSSRHFSSNTQRGRQSAAQHVSIARRLFSSFQLAEQIQQGQRPRESQSPEGSSRHFSWISPSRPSLLIKSGSQSPEGSSRHFSSKSFWKEKGKNCVSIARRLFSSFQLLVHGEYYCGLYHVSIARRLFSSFQLDGIVSKVEHVNGLNRPKALLVISATALKSSINSIGCDLELDSLRFGASVLTILAHEIRSFFMKTQ